MFSNFLFNNFIQICISGLHISLGVLLKFFDLLSDECIELELEMAAKEAETERIPAQSQYGEYVQTLCQSLQEKKAAEGYLVDAQAAEDYATYTVTLGGNELQKTDPNPLVTQLLSHAQDLRIKAKEKVTITTMA